MKLFFSTFLFLILSKSLFSNEFETQYQIKNRGITIGLLTWDLKIEKDYYETNINLKNMGILSKLYSFSGEYKAVGKIKNNFFISNEYNQLWKTKNKERFVKITYEDYKILKILLKPSEVEMPRIKYKELKNYNDPITSFLNILFNNNPSYTVDGRRSYLLSPVNKKNGSIKILIKEYTNIWADHKRKDLDYIEVFVEENFYLPSKINIMFGGSNFSLSKS